MKKKMFLLVLPLLFSWFTVPYELMKGAVPYKISVNASFEDFEKAAKDILVRYGYAVEQPYKPCLIGKSKSVDSHVYIEWFTDKKTITHASFWRIRYKVNPVSYDAKVNNGYEKLPPDKEIVNIGEEIKKQLHKPVSASTIT